MSATIHNLADNKAYTCVCGSVRFCLLASNAIECHGCGRRMSMDWAEHDTRVCDECAGTGRVDRSVKVDQSGCLDHITECCDACGGVGYVGADAMKSADARVWNMESAQ